MRRIALAAVALAVLPVMAGPASAQAPIALVEDITGNPRGIQLMDYVSAGKVIKLGAKDSVILGYMKSCQRETIAGAATITIGTELSEVRGGTVDREKINCDGGRMELTVVNASKSGAMVFRGAPKLGAPSPLALRPQFVIYGLSPVVELKAGTPVVIDRLDRPAERIILTPEGRKLRKNLYDFADDGQELARAGVYQATMGSVQVQFQVDLDAKPGRTPVAGRLLRLQASK